jgi:phosphoribosyl 1,2-cyclic phosphodiesterase
VHCQVLSSGSGGNSLLVRAGDLHVLVDAGLPVYAMRERLDAARLPHRCIDHILVTHGHLDHARSAGALAKKHGATVHAPEAILRHPSLRRAPRMSALHISCASEIRTERGETVCYRPVLLPHDCDPTVAFAIDHAGRRLVILTDMGAANPNVARELSGACILVLEFNHDREMLLAGPYPEMLKRRVGGGRGHLSNEEASRMLELLAGPELHTLVLAHLSETNNTPERAHASACATLERLGLAHVRVLIASQHSIGENLEV